MINHETAILLVGLWAIASITIAPFIVTEIDMFTGRTVFEPTGFLAAAILPPAAFLIVPAFLFVVAIGFGYVKIQRWWDKAWS